MNTGPTRSRVDWGHVAVLTGALAVILAYFYDVRATSLDLQNLIFVQPMVVAAVALYVVILVQIVRRSPDAPNPTSAPGTPEEEKVGESWPELGRIAILVVAFGFFVFGLERVGFDVCSFVFITVGLYACGERNPFALALFPAAATLALFYGFAVLVPYPMPTLLL